MPDAFPAGTMTDWRCWRVELDGDGVWTSAQLAAPPQFSQEARLAWRAGLVALAGGDATVILVSGAQDPLDLAWLVASADPPARIRILRAPRVEGEFEPLLLWEGGARSASLRADGTVEVRATLSLPGAHRPVCRDLSALHGFASAPRGTWLSQVFGRCARVRPVLLRAPSERNRILGALAHDATVVPLREGVDWPAPGAIQVADEVIFFDTIEGGSQLGDAEHPVTRFTPRDHPDGAAVWRLDTDGISWLVCDHAAEVVTVTSASEPAGPAIDGLTPSVEDFHGREATLLRALVMPTERTESPVATVRDALFGYAGNWQLTGSSNALRGARGFEDWGEAQGAILTAALPVLEADWIGNLARTTWRHDRIGRALLAFELTPHQGWDADTELHVTVSRDGESVSVAFSLSDDIGDLVELLGEGHLAVAPLQQRPWSFDTFVATAGWSDAALAIDALATVSHATGVRSGTNETLELRATRPWPSADESISTLRVVLRASSPDGAKCMVRVTDDDGIDAESDTFVPGTDPESLEFAVELPAPMGARALLAALRTEVLVTLDGTIELHEAWLDVGVPAPLPANALGVRASQRHLAVDATPLLEDSFDWGAFGGDSPRLRVRFELEGAPNYAPATIAGAHWRFESHPATVRPTAEIMATVEGRLTGADGIALPLDVIRELLTQEDFAGVPIPAEAEPAWDAAADELATRGVGYRAAIASSENVADALAAACGESAMLLVQAAAGWEPRVLTLVPEIAAPTAISPADCAFAASSLVGTTRGVPAPPLVLAASNDEGLAWTATASHAQGTARARWVDVGGDATLRAAHAWCGNGTVRMERELPAPDGLPTLGRALAFPDGTAGTVVQTVLRDGRFLACIDGTGALETLWQDGEWRIAHAPARLAVLFLHGGELLAEIDSAGNFLAAGGATIAPITAPGAAPVEIGDGDALVITARDGGDASVVRIEGDGAVVLTHEITTIAAPAAVAGPVWYASEGEVCARPDGNRKHWKLGPEGLEISGLGLFDRRLGG